MAPREAKSVFLPRACVSLGWLFQATTRQAPAIVQQGSIAFCGAVEPKIFEAVSNAFCSNNGHYFCKDNLLEAQGTQSRPEC